MAHRMLFSSVMTHRILIVDDDANVRASLSEALVEHGAVVEAADDGLTALALLERFDPEFALCDVRMSDIDGLSFLEMVRQRRPDVDVVLMTAFDDMETVASAMRGGAVDFLVKPIGLKQLLAVTDRVFEDRQMRRRAARQSPAPVRPGNPLVGRDPRMIEIYKLVGQAAATTANVLIRGESGTGKELVARAIHAHSSGAAEPFLAVNCAALPSTLLESELFGHVRGAFTGAHETRRGRFALAGHGVRTVDELGELGADEVAEFGIEGLDEERAAALILAARAEEIARLEREG